MTRDLTRPFAEPGRETRPLASLAVKAKQASADSQAPILR